MLFTKSTLVLISTNIRDSYLIDELFIYILYTLVVDYDFSNIFSLCTHAVSRSINRPPLFPPGTPTFPGDFPPLAARGNLRLLLPAVGCYFYCFFGFWTNELPADGRLAASCYSTFFHLASAPPAPRFSLLGAPSLFANLVSK